MRPLNMRSVNIAAALMILAQAANAQQPPDTITSDSFDNTAMGPSVLLNNVPNTSGGQIGNDGALGVASTGVGYVVLQANTSGSYNTGVGAFALYDNTTGHHNAALGYGALASNTTGNDNTAIGHDALEYSPAGSQNTALGTYAMQRTTGSNNTAAGYAALSNNTTGGDNTASGTYALGSNASGNGNTANGFNALYANQSGSYNAAYGFNALSANSTGGYTTAVGAYALEVTTTGGYDTAFGAYALSANTTGSNNTAFGYAALRSTTTGDNNIGFGYQSLYSGKNGSNNIAMGYKSAYSTNGSNNIEIGSQGDLADDGVIRIGTQGTQTAAYMAGVSDAKITGSAVYVTSSGQLGVLASSERYKTAIASMGSNTVKLQQLRPVSFHLKTDPTGTVQYGLIAEEVDKVYPELVIRDDTGKIQGVRYEELAPMLLSEMQHERKEMTEKLDAQAAEIRDLKKLVVEMQTGLLALRANDELVAQR
jgi:trimeric autotransporter adhesin